MVWDDVSKFTVAQHGLVATRQAELVGGDEDWLRWAVEDGLLEHVRRGVYGVVGSHVSEFRDLLAAILAGGDDVVAGGLATLWVFGARDVLPGALELLSFNGRCVRLRGVLIRRTGLPPDGMVTMHNGIPTAIAPLALIQVSHHRPELAIKAAKDLVVKGHTTFPEILRVLRGAAGQRANRALVRYAERCAGVKGHDDSPAAIDLGAALLDARVAPFVTQHVVSVPGGTTYVLDFAWPEHKVGLEYMGWVDHSMLVPDVERDARRRNVLTSLGWTILDATKAASHVEVVRWVKATLAQRASFIAH